jgi:RNA-directed DNA polymerase
VDMVNPMVMGWVNYFRHTNASQAFRGLQRFVNIRFRRYLTWCQDTFSKVASNLSFT